LVSILNLTSSLEDSCFYSGVPAEAVIIAILKCVSFQFMLPYEQKS